MPIRGICLLLFLFGSCAYIESAPALRVLYVEGSPRYEYHHLVSMLTRSADLVAQGWLVSADPGWEQAHSEGVAPLGSLPRTIEELASYDVILVGDVAIENPGSWYQALREYVHGGGGLGFIAGEKNFVEQVVEARIGDLLPVVLDVEAWKHVWRSPRLGREQPISVPAGEGLHPVLRVGESDVESRRIFDSLRFFNAVVVRATKKSGTTILEGSMAFHGPGLFPIAAVGSPGKGRTFFLATDDTWWWRRGQGVEFHQRFWHNVVRFLGGR